MTIRSSVGKPLALALFAAIAAPATTILLTPLPASAYSDTARYFDREQIEQLTAPIALYPDPLLAQILTAAAYPEEIARAHRFMQGGADWNGIDRQDWDYSVRAIARYPELLDFLARDLEWTQALGIANINQPDDVADAIQRWRLQAYNLGNLRSGSQQTVYIENNYVRIVPAEPDYFYVPRYEPDVVYVTRYVSTPFIIFGPAYAYGAWFDRDWDWRRRRICYTDRKHWHHGRPVFHPRFDDVHPDRDWKPDRVRFKPPETPRMPPRWTQTRVPSPPPHIRPGEKPDGSRDANRDGRRDDNRRDDNRRDNDGRDAPQRQQVKPGDTSDNPNDPRKFPTVRRGNEPDTNRSAPGNTQPSVQREGERNLNRGDAPDNPNDPRKFPTVRRDNERDFKREDRPSLSRPTPQPNVETPRRNEPPQRVEPVRVEPTRRIEQREEPRRVEQPRQQEQRKVEQPRVEQPKPQPQAQPQQQQQQQQPQRQAPSKRQDEEQQYQRGPRR